VAPGSEASECPLWLNFLKRITNDDVDLQTFLQRVAGYCLTGWNREDVFFFFFGTGRNGKGTFLNTLAAIFNDYAKTAPSEMFLASHGERHPADLAMLRGARLVVASETESGKRWAESRVKSLTGGDRVCCRFMRQDFFEYQPQFKLIVCGNHKPTLRNVDEAMRSRFYLVPFKVTIPVEERDKKLADRLRAEWPAILRWCIEGCLQWQQEGLNPPAAVTDASDEYMEDQDVIGRWLSECCVQGHQFEAASKGLFSNFKDWAQESNEYIPSQKTFSQTLSERRFEIEHRRKGSFVKGLALKADFPEGNA
jgi:putative DNA primase/helicase